VPQEGDGNGADDGRNTSNPV